MPLLEDRSIQEAIINGCELLPNGRRNFFSPVTQYKIAKARFFRDADGQEYSQRNVPVDKWEIDLLCEGTSYKPEKILGSTKPDNDGFDVLVAEAEKKRKAFLENLKPIEDPGFFKPEDVPEMSFNYCDSIFGSTVSDILLDKDFEEDDITIENLVESELQLVDDTNQHSFRRADLLEEIVKLDTVKDDFNNLDKSNNFSFFPNYFNSINEHIRRLELNTDKVDTVKESIKDNIRFLKHINSEKIKKFKKFDYSERENFLKQQISLSNVYKHLEILVQDCEANNWTSIDFDRFEISTFAFLQVDYAIDRKQQVALIPSGGGKTKLFSKFYKYVVDIDYLRVLNNDEEFFRFVFEYSKMFNRWNVINKYWSFILWKFQNFFKDKVLLAHSIHQLPFFKKGLQLIGIIPLKNSEYDKRFFKKNSLSIREETDLIFSDQQDLSFLRIYECFLRDSNLMEYHYQYFKGKKVAFNSDENFFYYV